MGEGGGGWGLTLNRVGAGKECDAGARCSCKSATVRTELSYSSWFRNAVAGTYSDSVGYSVLQTGRGGGGTDTELGVCAGAMFTLQCS